MVQDDLEAWSAWHQTDVQGHAYLRPLRLEQLGIEAVCQVVLRNVQVVVNPCGATDIANSCFAFLML